MWLFYGNQTPAKAVAPTRKYGWNVNEAYTEHELATRPELSNYKTFKYHPNLSSVKEIDLRSGYPVPPYDQGQIGSCTAQGWAEIYEFEAHKQQEQYIEMSRLGFYYQERDAMNKTDEDCGAQIKDGAKIIKDQGIGIAQIVPYDTSKYTEKPPQAYYDDLQYHKAVKVERVKKDINDITQCLLDGNPINLGIMIYESFESPDAMSTGVVPDPDTKKEKLLGGHCVNICGKKMIGDKQYFICRNSWGVGVQDKGYFYLSENFIMGNAGMFGMQPLCSDLWTIKLVHDDVDPNLVETNEQKLEHVKNLLGVEVADDNLETLFDKLRKLAVDVESKKAKHETNSV